MTGKQTIERLDTLFALCRAELGLDPEAAAERCFWEVSLIVEAADHPMLEDQATAATAWAECTSWRVYDVDLETLSGQMPSEYQLTWDHAALQATLVARLGVTSGQK